MSDGRWHPTAQVCHPEIGGSEGTRRLRELRKLVRSGEIPGFVDIEKRTREGSTQYEYRLAKSPELRQGGLF